MKKPPIWISGFGIVSSAGNTAEELWQTTYEKKNAMTQSPENLSLGRFSEETLASLRSQFFAKHPRWLGSIFEGTPLLLSGLALEQAMEQAGWEGLSPDDGIIFATTTGHVSTWDQELMQYFKKGQDPTRFYRAFSHERLGLMLDKIAEFLNFQGPRFLVTTACSASTHAFALAKMWLESGRVQRCLVGGTEVLSKLTTEGFRSFQLLSSQPCKPFDVSRNGINLSEGSGFVCLEKEPRKKLARLSGAGMSTDAYHMTAPHPEGRGSYQAMCAALREAGVQPADLSWIHAHGTGSTHNDLAEATAIRALLEGRTTPVSSTKGVHGHALAATGVLEAVLCVKAIEHQTILPTTGLYEQDPLIQISVPQLPISTQVKHILKNTLGFGGANGAIVFSAPGALE